MNQLKFKSGLIALLLMISSVFSLFAKEKGSAYFEFLEDPINSRSIAMGTAGTAVSNNRGFSFYNPAIAAINSRPYLSFDYGRQYSDLGRANPEFAWVSPRWFLGLSFLTQSTGTFKIATEQGIVDGSTQTDQSSVGTLNGGYKKENYAIGVSVNGIQHKLAEYTSYGVTGSVGAIFNLIDGKFYGGLAVFNFGRNSSFFDSTRALKKDNLPLTFRAGASWTDTLKGKFPYTIALDAVYSKNYEQVMVPIGIEFWIHPALALRIGKRINFKDDLFSIGTGLRYQNLGFDAAFTPTRTVSDIGLKWTMGISYYLSAPKKRAIKTSNKANIDSVKNTTDSSAQVAPSAPKDSLPSFKAPVEKKILRKKTIENDEGIIDSTNVITPNDTMKIPTNNNISPTEQPSEIGIKDANTSSVPDSSITPKTETTLPLKGVSPEQTEVQKDSSAIDENILVK